ncbi:hypothetical protein E3P92_02569 [Wallemia ichthyophaga]|nr:hypothetical protein E3P91_02992 [Wallemia ichthyophaga]TIA81010.1 hypothetical protein E3P98_02325 [Wallemia ichthyophaga]TIA90270.1 hypothetical protein E3P97_02647 [Wallemia ichthyophaga]TIA98881.1 hypothetical protein E3P95_02291 [Wallemia ichthyophaga]TIB00055.1 hypothetical protein E3P94_02348 [Wallemia ichthyophaga]
MGGEESGNGVKLADYILSNHKDGNDKKHNRILYLVGDKTASELSNILQDNGVLVDRLQVYATKRLSVEQLQFNIHKANAGDAKWIIIFSPSGADVIIPAIKEMELNVKVACIGPTTSKYVQEIMQVCVDAVPAKPDAQLLAEAMSRVD